MKTYKPHIRYYGYKLGASEDLQEALKSLGFKYVHPQIKRGCHWGDVWFIDEDLELARGMVDPRDRHFRVDTDTRFFYISPYKIDSTEHWSFHVESNKPKEYHYKPRRKRGPYHK